MEEAFLAIVLRHAPLTGLVGQRIQWGGREPGAAVALYVIGAPPDWTLNGPSGLVSARVQADCWGETYLASKAVADALQDAGPAVGQAEAGIKFKGCVRLDRQGPEGFGESPNRLYRTRIDLRVTFSPAI
jgi:hypothetical protein